MDPFESTFSVLLSLKDKIAALQNQVEELSSSTKERFHKVERDMEDIRNSTAQRFDKVDQNIEDVKVAKQERFSKLEATVEQLKDNSCKRFERLGARVELAMNELKESTADLNKKLAGEAQQWRARCDKTDNKIREHKSTHDIMAGNTKQHHDTLRGEVEKLWTLMRQNSMASHALRHFGVKLINPNGVKPNDGFNFDGNSTTSTHPGALSLNLPGGSPESAPDRTAVP